MEPVEDQVAERSCGERSGDGLKYSVSTPVGTDVDRLADSAGIHAGERLAVGIRHGKDAVEPAERTRFETEHPSVLRVVQQVPCPQLSSRTMSVGDLRRHAQTSAVLWRLLYDAPVPTDAPFRSAYARPVRRRPCVSNADRETLARVYPGAIGQPVHVVPTGVDTEYFSPSPLRSPQAALRNLIFTGSMGLAAERRRHAVLLPRGDADHSAPMSPPSPLTIVGRAPTHAVRRLADDCPGVVVTGRVDDVRPYMTDAAVYVVPLRIGGGTRLKIFEAMAMARRSYPPRWARKDCR